jgi:hypothetical protein
MKTKSVEKPVRKATKGEAKSSKSVPGVPVRASADEGAALAAFLQQARANLTHAPAKGLLDTLLGVDPSSRKIQACTRMPGSTHTPMTFKMDNRLIQVIDAVSREQNLAALISHLIVRGLCEVMRELDAAEKLTAFHCSYETTDRNAFCGVNDPKLLAMIKWVEDHPAVRGA